MNRSRVVAFGVGALSVAPVVLACGPYFPNAYFVFGQERSVAAMPEGQFYYELHRVLGLTPLESSEHPVRRPDPREVTIEADTRDLNKALEPLVADESERTAVVGRFIDLRLAARTSGDFLNPSFNIPQEFVLYAQGAFFYHGDDVASAIAKWKELLDLSPDQRRWRSVWAAYMIGRALLQSDPAQSISFFEQTRALAHEGFHDSLELAYNSLGWQAYAHNALGDTVAALHGYVNQVIAAEQKGCRPDINSIRFLCARAMTNKDNLHRLAQDPLCRKIVCAWAACNADPYFGYARREEDPWLEAISELDELNVPEAEHLAWAAYLQGDLDSARRWLDLVAVPSPYGQWIRAKLMLRDGRIDEAVAVLRSIVDAFPESDRVYDSGRYKSLVAQDAVKAELAVLLVGRQEYVNALDLLMRCGYWLDAAYVAERVLTVSELESYILTHADDPILAKPLEGEYWYAVAFGEVDREDGGAPMSRLDCLKYLLARRLARNGQWPRADVFYPEDMRGIAAQFTTHLHEGSAPIKPTGGPTLWNRLFGTQAERVVDLPRAEQLRLAAMMMREKGMELVGTELEPDWRIWNGVFTLAGASGYRLSDSPEVSLFELRGPELPESLLAVISASEDEKRRAALNVPKPNRRFHYRWKAADLMWESAGYLPNDKAETMRTLWQGGVWIKNQDPNSADRFYKALVWRNWNMPYARRADKLRWFPAEPPE